jgi:glycosyltransferase involved in cell wall biosynthesis
MQQSAYPLISICIPTFNGESYLREALDSVRQQSYKNIEVVISDNNSIDGTTQIIQDFVKEVDFPVTVVNNEIIGIGSNWNNCIRYCKGSYVKFLFQDDVLLKDCLPKMLEAIDQQDIGMSYCNKVLIGNAENSDQENNDLHFDHYSRYTRDQILKDRYLYRHPRNKIGEPTCVLIRKEVFDRVGFFNEKLKQSLDYEFYYRLMKCYRVKAVHEKLVQFRIHGTQATARNARTVLADSYLLPCLLLRNHFWKLHIRVRLTLVYKLFGGLVRLGQFRILRGFKKVESS